jgi:hypothetical protein
MSALALANISTRAATRRALAPHAPALTGAMLGGAGAVAHIVARVVADIR